VTFPAGHAITCCGYQCHQGVPAPWTCPACGTIHTGHIPAPPPGDGPPDVPAPAGTVP
jgi:hypothetical protein